MTQLDAAEKFRKKLRAFYRDYSPRLFAFSSASLSEGGF